MNLDPKQQDVKSKDVPDASQAAKLLAPVFHSRVKPTTDPKTGEPTLQFDAQPLPKGVSFDVLYFSRFGQYTLTTWRRGGVGDFYVGQTLWRGQVPIASGGGEIPLYKPPVPTPGTPPPEDQSVWKMVNPLIGKNGLSMTDIQGLQDPKNFTYLFPEQEFRRL
jgi:hypothetical protein